MMISPMSDFSKCTSRLSQANKNTFKSVEEDTNGKFAICKLKTLSVSSSPGVPNMSIAKVL